VESLRLVMAELMVADVRSQVMLSLRNDFVDYTQFKPAAHHEKSLNAMLDQVILWGEAMKQVRQRFAASAA